jgi:hypothetical protein
MAGLENSYQQVPSEAAGPEPVSSRRSFKVGITLLGGTFLVLFSIAATTSARAPTAESAGAAESTNLLGMPSLKPRIPKTHLPSALVPRLPPARDGHSGGFADDDEPGPNEARDQGKKGKTKGGFSAFMQRGAGMFQNFGVNKEDGNAASPRGDLYSNYAESSYQKESESVSRFKNTVATFMPAARPQTVLPGSVLYSPFETPSGLTWNPYKYVGFLSDSRSSFDASTGVWSGTVGLGKDRQNEYYGLGKDRQNEYSGIRTPVLQPPLDLQGCTGLRLKVKGGGQWFKLIIHDDQSLRSGYSWAMGFRTKPDDVTHVSMPLAGFQMFQPLMQVPAGTLNWAKITGLQLLHTSADQKGTSQDFEMMLEEVGTY